MVDETSAARTVTADATVTLTLTLTGVTLNGASNVSGPDVTNNGTLTLTRGRHHRQPGQWRDPERRH